MRHFTFFILTTCVLVLVIPDLCSAQRKRLSICYDSDDGSLVARRRCSAKRNETALDGSNIEGIIGVQGPQGEQGAQGEKGEKGDSATKHFAAVDKDRTIIAQSDSLVSVDQLGGVIFGGYAVVFDTDLSGCVPVTSQANYNDGAFDGTPYALLASIDTTDTSQVNVIPTIAFGIVQRGFNLAVFCP
jgi:hypothetical protein